MVVIGDFSCLVLMSLAPLELARTLNGRLARIWRSQELDRIDTVNEITYHRIDVLISLVKPCKPA